MSLAEDIAAARKGGQSDDNIINGLKAFDSTYNDDIDGAIKAGRSSKDIIDGLAAFDQKFGPTGTAAPEKSMWSKVKNAVLQSATSDLQGYDKTLQVDTSTDPNSGTNQALRAGQEWTKPDADYVPAGVGLSDKSKSLTDRAGYIPRAMLENSTGLLTDLAAGEAGAAAGGMVGGAAGSVVPGLGTAVGGGIGAILGGIAGAGTSYMARNHGRDAQRAADARTGLTDAPINSEDRTRAAAADAIGGIASRVGVKGGFGPTGVIQAGDSVAGGIARQIGKGAAVDASTSVGSDAASKVLVDRENPLDDPNGAALSALQGAGAGALARVPGAVKEVAQARKFSDIDPENGGRLAELYNGRDFGTQREAYKAVEAVDNDLAIVNKSWTDKTKPLLKGLDEAAGFADDTDLVLKRAQGHIDRGEQVPAPMLDDLQDRIGTFKEGANLVDTMRLQNSQNLIKSKGRFDTANESFGGGLSNTDAVRAIDPLGNGFMGKVAKHGAAAAAGIEAIPGLAHLAEMGGVNPSTLLAPAAAGAIAKTAARGIDGLLGNTNPLGEFHARFNRSGTEGPTTGPTVTGRGDPPVGTGGDLPSYVQTRKNLEDQAAAKAAEAKANSDGTQAVAKQTGSDVARIAKQAILSQRAKAPEAPEVSPGRVGAGRSTNAPEGASQGLGEASKLRTVHHAGFEVSYDPSFVRNPKAYDASIINRIDIRQKVFDSAREAAPEAKSVLNTIEHSLNTNTLESPQDAAHLIETIANDHPEHAAAVLTHLDKPSLWGSFRPRGEKDTPSVAKKPQTPVAEKPQPAPPGPERTVPTKAKSSDVINTLERLTSEKGSATMADIMAAHPELSRSEVQKAIQEGLSKAKPSSGPVPSAPAPREMSRVNSAQTTPTYDKKQGPLRYPQDDPGMSDWTEGHKWHITHNIHTGEDLQYNGVVNGEHSFTPLGKPATLNKTMEGLKDQPGYEYLSHGLKTAVDILPQVFKDLGVDGTKVHHVSDIAMKDAMKEAYGYFNPHESAQNIVIAPSRALGTKLMTYVTVHEGVHAAVFNKMRSDPETTAMFNSMFKYVDQNSVKNTGVKHSDLYGGTNADEMIAEALSSEAYKQHLSMIPVSAAQVKSWGLSGSISNAWDALKAAFRKTLGLSDSKEINNMLDAVLHGMDKTTQKYAGEVSRQRKADLLERYSNK